ncbi:hypothetical protein T484DRAFT_2679650 [Baffinella frigidus]|nr:hypothetical protein T484DRAFT_2679650 [Cryptophyta sp. CCMP2293]
MLPFGSHQAPQCISASSRPSPLSLSCTVVPICRLNPKPRLSLTPPRAALRNPPEPSGTSGTPARSQGARHPLPEGSASASGPSYTGLYLQTV